MIVVRLDALDWAIGGGSHHTGHLYFSDNRPRVEMERDLSLSEAKDLWADRQGPEHTERWWNAGIARRTNRFETSADLQRAATKWCEDNITGDYVLKDDSNGRIIAHRGVNPVRVRVLNLLIDCEDKAYVWRAGFADMPRERADAFYAAKKAWRIE